MFAMLAVLVYLVAMGIPIYLLVPLPLACLVLAYLVVLAAVGMGFIPIPPRLQKPSSICSSVSSSSR